MSTLMALIVSAVLPMAINKMLPESTPFWVTALLGLTVSVFAFYYTRKFFNDLKP